jgi:HK97 family phage prohead protease
MKATKMERKRIDLVGVELKRDAEEGIVSGYGAVFGNVDLQGDEIEKGAFSKSLRAWKSRGKFPKMLLQHGGIGISAEDGIPVGQWTSMKEDDRGLRVEGRLFAMNTDKGQYIFEGLKTGELDGLSIGFEILADRIERRDGDAIRILTELKLWEVSLVTFPANPEARVTGVKMTPSELRELEASLREGGLSRSDAVMAISRFKQWLQRDVEVPVHAPGDPKASDELAEIVRLCEAETMSALAAVIRSAA